MKPPTRTVRRYVKQLKAAGVPDREATRAGLYVSEYGIDSLAGGCVEFTAPTCGNWDCLKPSHQVVVPVDDVEAGQQ